MIAFLQGSGISKSNVNYQKKIAELEKSSEENLASLSRAKREQVEREAVEKVLMRHSWTQISERESYEFLRDIVREEEHLAQKHRKS